MSVDGRAQSPRIAGELREARKIPRDGKDAASLVIATGKNDSFPVAAPGGSAVPTRRLSGPRQRSARSGGNVDDPNRRGRQRVIRIPSVLDVFTGLKRDLGSIRCPGGM